LAIGEDKGHVYRSMIGEALLVGFFGSAIGTLFGLAISYYIQMQGIDISGMLQDASMVMPDVLRTQVTFGSFYIGFIPGLLATLLGTAISGIGIYKRQTSRLAKEMES
jgi:putative ABC transport system permease protein